ncbi:hypothetical protein PM082_014037 [Marasmius tenuissimus]|nr:hypothetical protein PM082_014037 [Marasmius tenuissimus]
MTMLIKLTSTPSRTTTWTEKRLIVKAITARSRSAQTYGSQASRFTSYDLLFAIKNCDSPISAMSSTSGVWLIQIVFHTQVVDQGPSVTNHTSISRNTWIFCIITPSTRLNVVPVLRSANEPRGVEREIWIVRLDIEGG